MAASRPNISDDLIWQTVRTQNAFLVKRTTGGGALFSRDPLNLTNLHARKYAGFASSKAVGVQPGENGGVVVTTKNPKRTQQPASSLLTTKSAGKTSTRKIYKGIASRTACGDYRPDLRAEAVSRASAIRKSQRPVKKSPAPKLRGAKARRAAEKSE